MKSGSETFMSCIEAITCLPQIITLRCCEERMGHTKGYKGSTMMQASTAAAVIGEKVHLGMKRH